MIPANYDVNTWILSLRSEDDKARIGNIYSSNLELANYIKMLEDERAKRNKTLLELSALLEKNYLLRSKEYL